MELAVGSDRELFLFDSVPESTPKSITLHKGNIEDVCWNHKNQIVATCGSDGKLSFVVASDCTERQIIGPHASQPQHLRTLAFSHDSHHLAFAGDAGTVNVFDLRKQQSRIVPGFDATIASLAYSTSGGLIAFGDVLGNVAVYDTVQNARIDSIPATDSVESLCFSRLSGSTIGIAYRSGAVKVWDTARLNSVETFNAHETAATGVGFYPNNKALFVSCGTDKTVAFYNLQQNKLVQTYESQTAFTGMSIRSDGKLVALGDTEGNVTLLDFRNLKAPYGMLRTGTARPITSLVYTHKSKSRRRSNADGVRSTSSSAANTPTGQQQQPQVSQHQPATTTPASSLSASKQSPMSQSQPFSAAEGKTSHDYLGTLSSATLGSSTRIGPAPAHSREAYHSQSSAALGREGSTSRGARVGEEAHQSSTPKQPHPSSTDQVPKVVIAHTGRLPNPENTRAPTYVTAPPTEHGIAPADAEKVVHRLRQEREREDALRVQFEKDALEKLKDLPPSESQIALMREMIDGALSSFRFELFRNVSNIHFDLFRLFEQQKTELEALVRATSVNDDLLAEMRRLQEENKQLRLRLGLTASSPAL